MDMFFFSSRRRHTRYWRDWSSDVCSSDLWSPTCGLNVLIEPRSGTRFRPGLTRPGRSESWRSEERRVGKECRAWWTPYHCTINEKNTHISDYAMYEVTISSLLHEE